MQSLVFMFVVMSLFNDSVPMQRLYGVQRELARWWRLV